MSDWESFLNGLLDGEYSVDLRKSGSVVMFARNQLGSHKNLNTEKSRFCKSLQDLIGQRSFSTSDSLKAADTYLAIIDLGIEFLGTTDNLSKKAAALYLQLADFEGKLNERTQKDKGRLQIKCCLSLVKFIEHWKNQQEIIGTGSIYPEHGFLENVSRKWKEELISIQPLQNHNVLIGIIYLNEWGELLKKNVESFFRNNGDNEALFGSIINDMERVMGNKLFKYHGFLRDSEIYHRDFYQTVDRLLPYWTGKGVGPWPEAIGSLDPESYDYYANSLKEEGLLDKTSVEYLLAEAMKNDEEDI